MTELAFPSKVKIGWRGFRIEDWDPKEAAGARRYGECSPLSQVIRVDMSHGPRQAAHTLLHEILHAVFQVFELRKEDDEEAIVSTASHGLSTVWHDNPEVFAWINTNLVGGA